MAKTKKVLDVAFLCDLYFGVSLTPMQVKLVRAVAAREHKRIVISCLTRYGKTFVLGIAVLLYIELNPDKRINLIAPTSDQAHILKNYINDFIVGSEHFTKLVDLGATGIERMRKEVSKSRITFKNGCTLKVLSAEGTGNRLMGFGADLVIVDESCLINPEVYRAKINRMLGDNPESMLVEIGNPSKRDSHMFQHWFDDDFKKIHVDYKIALAEGRISQAFVDEQRKNLTNNEFRVLYEAEFPNSEVDALIMWEWVEDAKKKEMVIDGDVIFGLDVAEGGVDLSVLTKCVRDGNRYVVKGIWRWHQADTVKTANAVAQIVQVEHEQVSIWNNEHPDKQKRFPEINVDTTGVGKGVGDMLADKGFFVNQIKVGRAPTREVDRFANLKAQYWFRVRSIFEDRNILIEPIEFRNNLVNELLLMKWDKTAAEKVRIVDPEVKSPDFADSLMLAMAGHEPLIFDF